MKKMKWERKKMKGTRKGRIKRAKETKRRKENKKMEKGQKNEINRGPSKTQTHKIKSQQGTEITCNKISENKK